jgi:hypothetical protein
LAWASFGSRSERTGGDTSLFGFPAQELAGKYRSPVRDSSLRPPLELPRNCPQHNRQARHLYTSPRHRNRGGKAALPSPSLNRMSYTAEISRQNPSCICLIIDQSGSMTEQIAGGERRKCEFLSDAVNKVLESLSVRCQKGDEIRDYFDIIAVGYGATVSNAFGGALSQQDVVSISQLANTPARVDSRAKKVDDGAGGIIEQQVKFPIWIDPVASGGTPMCAAFTRALGLIEKWANGHRTSFPPVVIHFTDGESTDGDPTEVAHRLMAVSTTDGQALLFNAHISARGGTPVVFPETANALPDQFAQLLFGISSALPGKMSQQANSLGYSTGEGSKGFIYNAQAEHIVGLLEIGTRPSDLR